MENSKCLNSDETKYLLRFDTSIFNMISDGAYLRKDDTIVFCNPIASQILACSAENKIEGHKITELIAPLFGNEEVYRVFVKRASLRGDVLPTRVSVRRVCDGKELNIEFSSRVIYYKEEIVFLDIIKDVSEVAPAEMYKKEYEKSKRMLDEAIEYDRVKTEFFENLSHEFRTPLNVIMGIIQLQEHVFKNNDIQNVYEHYKKYNEILKQNCYRLVRMVNNVLDITKIESGYLTLNLKNDNIVNTIEDITMSVVDYARSLGISIIFDTDVEEKLMAFDADNMERIILNLLSNAVKFTPEGKNIYVNLKDEGDSIIISIKDEGEGIPLEKQQFIFKRFIQADSSYRKRRSGTGIGLSLVKSLVEMHGGCIDLKSEIGKGSEFIITLPVYSVEEKGLGVDRQMDSQNNVERVSIEFSDIYNVNI